MKKVYLATPYTGTPEQQEQRFIKVNKVAARLMREGILVFSPISHTHPIALAGDLPKGWEFWKDYDFTFIEWADEIHVLKLPGWETSIGVSAEIALGVEMNKPIVYIEPRDR